MSKARVVIATAGAASAVLRGHPWIWREGVARAPEGGALGDVVEIRDGAGGVLGQGLWDPSSPIAVRLYARAATPRLDVGGIAHGIERAIERRRVLASNPAVTNAYRLCHGEGDRVPGVVLDRYDTVAVLRLDGQAISGPSRRARCRAWPLLASRGIRSLSHRVAGKGGEGQQQLLFGDPLPETIVVRENGMAMVVDLVRGQKTGASSISAKTEPGCANSPPASGFSTSSATRGASRRRPRWAGPRT